MLQRRMCPMEMDGSIQNKEQLYTGLYRTEDLDCDAYLV